MDAYYFVLKRPQISVRLGQTKWGAALHRFWFTGWGFDWLDNEYIVKPFVRAAKMDKDDWVDLVPTVAAELSVMAAKAVDGWHNGRLRRYAAGVVLGAVVLLTAVILIQ